MKTRNNRLVPIKFSDGEEFQTDSIVLFERADFLASNYGLGGFRSFSDFVKMVDEEDPFIMNGLIYSAFIRIQASHGIENERTKANDDDTEIITTTSRRTKRDGDSKEMLVRFLKDFGTSNEEMKIVEEKLKNTKIPEEDFSWITPEILAGPDFDLKGTLSRMSDCYKRSVNVNVSLDTLERKKKKNVR